MRDQRNNSELKQGQSAPPQSRIYVDAEGMRWEVYERPFDPFDRRSGMSLIFAAEGAMRRVRNYPENWMELSDADLAALSWNA